MSDPPSGRPSRKAPSGRSGRGAGDLITPEITPDNSDETQPLYPVILARFRAASPGLPRLPLRQARVPLPAAVKELSGAIHTKTTEKLKKFDILNEDTEIDVDMYGTYGRSDICCPTVLIITKWELNKEEARKRVVESITKFATEEVSNRDKSIGAIQVDMIDPRLTNSVFYGPVKNQPQLFNRWEQIQALVFRRLESFPQSSGQMTAILLLHYGLNKHYTQNPITIYISVDYDSQEVWWPEIIRDIQYNLASHGLPVLDIHMEHNIGVQTAFPLVQPTGSEQDIMQKMKQHNHLLEGDYQTLVNLGDSIGAERYLKLAGEQKSPLSGTLGCYLELKTANSQKWETYALTNYHVVRPTIDGFQLKVDNDGNAAQDRPRELSKLWTADQQGLRPGTSIPSAHMESPCRLKHNYTIWSLRQQINEINALPYQNDADNREKQDLVRELSGKTAFFDNFSSALGKVYAGSGHMRRTPENNRLDWALIRVKETRIGKNDLPGQDAWRSLPAGKPRHTYGIRLQDQAQSISELTPDQRCYNAFKLGATTGATAGVFHNVKFPVQLKHEAHVKPQPSREYLFQPQGGPKFADRGDSGSVVYDNEGRIVGLMFTGQVPQNGPEPGFGYVTPIEYVFKDILNMFEGQITHIRVAL